MDLQLTDKVAIVTGSSRGLGLASAKALAAEGCRVTLCARGAERLEQAADDVRAVAPSASNVMVVAADVSTEAGVRTIVERTIEEWAGVDILVNNVGVARGGDIVVTSDAEWLAAFDQTRFPAIRAA
ncbi:MAG: SDR family NAD(P)-dependent oxidoreductase, partial [Vicinamibacteraceae bacterium]